MILHGTYMDEEGLEIMIERNVPLVPTFTFQANLMITLKRWKLQQITKRF